MQPVCSEGDVNNSDNHALSSGIRSQDEINHPKVCSVKRPKSIECKSDWCGLDLSEIDGTHGSERIDVGSGDFSHAGSYA